jgi:hypothetical protein
MAEKRRSHFFRVIGKDSGGNDVQGTYLDLLRLNYFQTVEGGGQDFLRINHHPVEWYAEGGTEPNPARKTTTVNIIPPDEDPNNPSVVFPVDVNDSIRVKTFQMDKTLELRLRALGFEAREHRQMVTVHFDNSEENFGRKVSERRIPHRDTTIDDLPQYEQGGVIETDEYVVLHDTRDDEQYVDTEFVEKFRFIDVDQKFTASLNNQALIDRFDEPGANREKVWRIDPLQMIVNIKTAPQVYVVITAAKSDYAVANKGTVIETQQAPGPQSPFMTGTLIQCSVSAGEAFASLASTLVGGTGGDGSTLIAVMVYPKTDEVRASWWDYAQAYQGQNVVEDSIAESGPFLWISQFRAWGPCNVDFKIRNKPHLIDPPADVRDTIVQAYPTTGAHDGTGGLNQPVSVLGYSNSFYRTDKDGTGPIYTTAPEWATDVIFVDAGIPSGFLGLLFGEDPPLIAADVPN